MPLSTYALIQQQCSQTPHCPCFNYTAPLCFLKASAPHFGTLAVPPASGLSLLNLSESLPSRPQLKPSSCSSNVNFLPNHLPESRLSVPQSEPATLLLGHITSFPASLGLGILSHTAPAILSADLHCHHGRLLPHPSCLHGMRFYLLPRSAVPHSPVLILQEPSLQPGQQQ